MSTDKALRAAVRPTARLPRNPSGETGTRNRKILSLSQPDFDKVIALLHEGVFQKPYWTAFLATLRCLTDASYASLTFRRADARHRDVNVIKSGFAETDPEFADIHELVKTLKLPYESIDLNRPYNLQEILDLADDRNAGYIRYLTSRHINYAFVIRVAEPGGGTCWLTLGRPENDFADGIRTVMTRLAPHLSIAARTLAALEREHLRADVAADAVRRLNFGWATFDDKGRVIEIEPGLERLFLSTPGFNTCRRGQVLPVPRAQLLNLSALLANFTENPAAKPSAFHLSDEPCLDMLIVPISYRAVSGGLTPVAVGYVHWVGPSSADRSAQLAELFGLTRNEARLAVALSEGKSIIEAAAELKLAIETVRNYSKRIYAKTDTRGQADLVRVILASVIALT